MQEPVPDETLSPLSSLSPPSPNLSILEYQYEIAQREKAQKRSSEYEEILARVDAHRKRVKVLLQKRCDEEQQEEEENIIEKSSCENNNKRVSNTSSSVDEINTSNKREEENDDHSPPAHLHLPKMDHQHDMLEIPSSYLLMEEKPQLQISFFQGTLPLQHAQLSSPSPSPSPISTISSSSSSNENSLSSPQSYAILQLICPEYGCLWFGNTESALDRHLFLGHRLQPNRCPVSRCSHSYQTSHQLNRHIVLSHHEPEGLQCRLCDEGLFEDYRKLRRHYKDSHHLGAFQCSFCGMIFNSRQHLYDHQAKDCQMPLEADSR